MDMINATIKSEFIAGRKWLAVTGHHMYFGAMDDLPWDEPPSSGFPYFRLHDMVFFPCSWCDLNNFLFGESCNEE